MEAIQVTFEGLADNETAYRVDGQLYLVAARFDGGCVVSKWREREPFDVHPSCWAVCGIVPAGMPLDFTAYDARKPANGGAR